MPHGSNRIYDFSFPNVNHRTVGEKTERFVSEICDGTLIGYKYFSFEDLHTATLKVKGEGTGTFRIGTDMDGEPVGEAIFDGAPDWTDLVIPVSDVSGVKPLYIRYDGSGRADMLELTLD